MGKSGRPQTLRDGVLDCRSASRRPRPFAGPLRQIHRDAEQTFTKWMRAIHDAQPVPSSIHCPFPIDQPRAIPS